MSMEIWKVDAPKSFLKINASIPYKLSNGSLSRLSQKSVVRVVWALEGEISIMPKY